MTYKATQKTVSRLAIALCATCCMVGCATQQAADARPLSDDPIMAERLSNFPKVRPWPIAWFTPKETVGGAEDQTPLSVRAEPKVDDAAWVAITDWAQRLESDTVMVWKDSAIDRVWTRDGFDPDTLLNTYYLNYFALVTLVGAAIEDGFIEGVDQRIGDFLPEWDDDPRGEIRVEDLLQMSSGLELYKDSIDPAAKSTQLFFGSRTTEAAILFDKAWEPGTKFEYNYLVPEILGIVVERASGKRYADYLSERVWKPIGASDAQLWLDREGGRPHFNAALYADADDWLRLGILLAQEGRFGDRQVVPASWVEAMMTPSPAKANYGYAWLSAPYEAERRMADTVNYVVNASEPIADDRMIILDGYGGQRVYVSPDDDLVIVRIGLFQKDAWDDSFLPNAVIAGLSQD
ncbi:MAG: serine hydrolase [Pseudomonadota bacterium]